MMAAYLGQLLLTSIFVQFFPADFSIFEEQVGERVEAFSLPAFAEAQDFNVTRIWETEEGYPTKINTASYGVVTSAESSLVVDDASSMMLLAEHPYEVRPIGSVTKLMAALVFLDEDPDLDAYVSLDPALDLVEGGRVYLAFYDPILLRDVFAVSIVGSDNTATESLARFVGLSKEDFVLKMNDKAKSLGMHDSVFTDPTGIESSNVSTAADLVRLLKAAAAEPHLTEWMQSASVTVEHQSGRRIFVENTNGVLQSYLNEGEYKVVAGKTGYLPLAGYVLATTIDRGGDAVHIVVLGSDTKEDREYDVRGLATWAYQTFSWPDN